MASGTGSTAEPSDVIIRSVEGGSGLAIRATARDRTVGLATAHVLEGPAATFLVYLAVDAGEQNGHVPGSADTSALVRAIYFEKYHAANGIPAATLEALASRVMG